MKSRLIFSPSAGVICRRRAFSTGVSGCELSFVWDGEGFVGLQTSNRWDLLGRAHAGPLAGCRPTPLTHENTLWFACAAFFRETRVYGAGR